MMVETKNVTYEKPKITAELLMEKNYLLLQTSYIVALTLMVEAAAFAASRMT